jgi:hypothetical protein
MTSSINELDKENRAGVCSLQLRYYNVDDKLAPIEDVAAMLDRLEPGITSAGSDLDDNIEQKSDDLNYKQTEMDENWIF